MSDFLTTSLSGLLSFQRALATTSNNVANVNTEGFSRQRVNFAALPSDSIGSLFIGRGVEVTSITRFLDQFKVDQLRVNIAEQARLSTFTERSSNVDSLLANSATGLSEPMQEFFAGLQAVADSPSSLTARQVVISQAGILADRFTTLQSRLETQSGELDARLSASVNKVNALAAAVADLNRSIAGAGSVNGAPNDLLDQRDLVLRELAELVSVELVETDGAVNVFVGNGQALVLGQNANSLTINRGEFGGTELSLLSNGISTILGTSVSGGEIGGLMDFRREVLDPTRNALGQLAISLAQTFNAQHQAGMDLQGNLGGDFFTVGAPDVLASSRNVGAATVSATVIDVGSLTRADYVLAFDGATYTLSDKLSGSSIPMTGSGSVLDPFVVDGLSIVVGGGMVAGDEYLIRPTHSAAADFAVSLTNPAGYAAALPIRTSALISNSGDGSISGEQVLDVTDPNLLNSVTIEFLDATTFSINGAGSFAYTPGAPIEANGWRVRIAGNPDAGDQFTIASNAGATGDNRNALELAGALDLGVLNGGTTSVRDTFGNLVSQVSSNTRRAEINLVAQNAITDQSLADYQSVSGVNLDEEAANMLRFQQAYQAAAQLIGVADILFQTLLGAVRR